MKAGYPGTRKLQEHSKVTSAPNFVTYVKCCIENDKCIYNFYPSLFARYLWSASWSSCSGPGPHCIRYWSVNANRRIINAFRFEYLVMWLYAVTDFLQPVPCTLLSFPQCGVRGKQKRIVPVMCGMNSACGSSKFLICL